MPLDVVCPQCCEIYVETNDEDGWIKLEHSQIPNPRVKRFNPDMWANGSMFRLKQPFVSWGWECFPQDEAVIGESLQCPGCNASLADTEGRIITRAQPKVKGAKAHAQNSR